MSHVTHMNESWHTHKRVTSHTQAIDSRNVGEPCGGATVRGNAQWNDFCHRLRVGVFIPVHA